MIVIPLDVIRKGPNRISELFWCALKYYFSFHPVPRKKKQAARAASTGRPEYGTLSGVARHYRAVLAPAVGSSKGRDFCDYTTGIGGLVY